MLDSPRADPATCLRSRTPPLPPRKLAPPGDAILDVSVFLDHRHRDCDQQEGHGDDCDDLRKGHVNRLSLLGGFASGTAALVALLPLLSPG